MGLDLAILAALIALYAVVATKLGRWSISGPMAFVAIGFLLGPRVLGILTLSPEAEGVKSLTEITLALLLFADASTLNLRQVRGMSDCPLVCSPSRWERSLRLCCCQARGWPSPP